MKKILAAALAVFMFTGSAFAIDFSADLNFALPYDFTSSTNTNSFTLLGIASSTTTTTKNTESGIGADAGFKAMLTDMFGIKANVGLYFPQEYKSSTTITSKSSDTSSTSTSDPVVTKYADAFDSFIAFNIFVGPAIRVQNKKAFSITVTPGLSIDMRTASYTINDEKKSTSYQYWGIGAEIDATYNITKKIYLNFSCPAVYQFKIVDSDDNEKERKGFYLVPKIGLGYNF